MSSQSISTNSAFVGLDFPTESAIMKGRFQLKENAMKPIRKLFAALIILSLSVLACNLPSNTATQPADLSNALTLAVQTIQAATQQAPTSTNTASPAVTPSSPTVTVSSPTNCRGWPRPELRACAGLSTGRDRGSCRQRYGIQLLDHPNSNRWYMLVVGSVCHCAGKR